jgi:hypothetical protein
MGSVNPLPEIRNRNITYEKPRPKKTPSQQQMNIPAFTADKKGRLDRLSTLLEAIESDTGSPTNTDFPENQVGIPLPAQHDGIRNLAKRGDLPSWVMKGATSVFGSNLTPGNDMVVLLEAPDGGINYLRVILTPMRETDIPLVEKQCGPACRLSVLWNEFEVVSCVLLTVSCKSDALTFLLRLVTAFFHTEDWVFNSHTDKEASK